MFLKKSTMAVLATACSDALIWARLRPLRANFSQVIFSCAPRRLSRCHEVSWGPQGMGWTPPGDTTAARNAPDITQCHYDSRNGAGHSAPIKALKIFHTRRPFPTEKQKRQLQGEVKTLIPPPQPAWLRSMIPPSWIYMFKLCKPIDKYLLEVGP